MLGAKRSSDLVFSALIVRGRTEPAGIGRGWIQALQPSVERKVEIVSGLLTVSDYIQSSGELIMHCSNHRVRPHFFNVGFAELIEMGGCELEPSGKWIAPDYSRLQRTTLGFGIRTRLRQKTYIV